MRPRLQAISPRQEPVSNTRDPTCAVKQSPAFVVCGMTHVLIERTGKPHQESLPETGATLP